MTTPVGRRLRQAREHKGWTLAELSVKCHQSPQTISAIETGSSRHPRTATALIIAGALDVPQDEVLELLALRQEVSA